MPTEKSRVDRLPVRVMAPPPSIVVSRPMDF